MHRKRKVLAALAGRRVHRSGGHAGGRCGSRAGRAGRVGRRGQRRRRSADVVGHLADQHLTKRTRATTAPINFTDQYNDADQRRRQRRQRWRRRQRCRRRRGRGLRCFGVRCGCFVAGAGGRRPRVASAAPPTAPTRTRPPTTPRRGNTIAAGAATAGNTVTGGVSQTQDEHVGQRGDVGGGFGCARRRLRTAGSATAASSHADRWRQRRDGRRPIVVQAASSDIGVSQSASANSGANVAVNATAQAQRRVPGLAATTPTAAAPPPTPTPVTPATRAASSGATAAATAPAATSTGGAGGEATGANTDAVPTRRAAPTASRPVRPRPPTARR